MPNLIRDFTSLFIVVDPLGNLPIFMGLTERMSEDERRRVFRTATVTGFILLLTFAAAGQQLLNLFGISIPSFMIAGGVLLLIISIQLLVSEIEVKATEPPESVGAVPIACPLLVGPGAITTTILNLQTTGPVATVASVILIFLVVWLVLRFIDPLYRFLGRRGALVVSRVMALFIAAIAVQYVIDGLLYYLGKAGLDRYVG
ncbi:MarC family protein [Candidatus Bathyarchaeota archaeon]|nr:MarC family protein [Candidatus Bathyarchaeota archaeon]